LNTTGIEAYSYLALLVKVDYSFCGQ